METERLKNSMEPKEALRANQDNFVRLILQHRLLPSMFYETVIETLKWKMSSSRSEYRTNETKIRHRRDRGQSMLSTVVLKRHLLIRSVAWKRNSRWRYSSRIPERTVWLLNDNARSHRYAPTTVQAKENKNASILLRNINVHFNTLKKR